uniref:Alpha-ketoglutarate-dependent dioxygenase FTO n=1 Tax=Gadus morhua TaxID=8049 RepID=A0A8C5CLS9_GADMO
LCFEPKKKKEMSQKKKIALIALVSIVVPLCSAIPPPPPPQWDSSYSGLVLRPSCSLPTELHGRVQAALSTLRTKGCLLRDLVRVRDRDVFTSVSRALLGQPGHTYRYLDTRLFEAKAGSPRCCDPDMRAACQALWALNSFFCTDVPRREPEERLDLFIKAEGVVGKGAEPDGGGTGESKHSDECTVPPQFNVTLLNFMDPAAMRHLKEEPYYGMGKMAVGWHHDENLIAQSPVAVYSYSCHSDAGEDLRGLEVSRWRIGLKVAWDIYTPGLALPLQSGDCYYMRDDLNTTHQHCVLAGDNARFSSTHRVAECSKGTLEYIQSRCTEALANLGVDPESGAHSLRSLLPLTLKHCEDIHNEVEFEWLRQYWFQGQRYTRFCSWWSGPMELLERDWKLMETMVGPLHMAPHMAPHTASHTAPHTPTAPHLQLSCSTGFFKISFIVPFWQRFFLCICPIFLPSF